MGLSLYSQAGIAQANADISGLAGYLSLSIPLFAWGVIKGMSSVFSQAAQYIAGVTQGAATSAAGEAASGNYSMGNLNYNNQSSFNTSANHFDTSGRVSGGMYTTQMSGGSTLSMTPDGSVVMNNQGAISNLGTTVHLAQSIRAAYTRQAEVAETAGYNQLKASSNSMGNAIRNIYELGNHSNISTSSGESWSNSTNAGVSNAINNIHKMTDQFAHSHNISVGEAAAVLGTTYTEGHVGADIGVNVLGSQVKAGVSAGNKQSATNTSSVENKALYTDAQNFANENGFAHNVDIVQRAVHENSLRSSDDTGNRLIENMGASLDQAASSRNEASSSFQQAQSYRESATLTEENAANINSNASQVVMESLRKQGMSPSQIEDMMVNHPDVAESKASEAIQAYTENFEQGWSHGLSDSVGDIKQDANQDDAQVKTQEEIKSEYATEHNKVEKQAALKGLINQHLINESAKTEAQQRINESSEKVWDKNRQIRESGNALYGKTKKEESRDRTSMSGTELMLGIDTKDD